MNLKNQRRMASELLHAGINRVWIDPDHIEEVGEAVTRGDIRSLIKQGVIKAVPKRGLSNARKKRAALQRAKGRRRGPGSRKGSAQTRQTKKERWSATIRPIRAQLRAYRDEDKLAPKAYRRCYRLAKGGSFEDVDHLITYIESHNMWSPKEKKEE